MSKIKKYIPEIKKFITGLTSHRIGTYSAACAYYIFICIIPFLTILLYLISFTLLDDSTVINLVDLMFPSYTTSLVLSIVNEITTTTSSILPFSIIVMIWTASKTMVYVRNGLNDINNLVDTKNYFLARLIGSVYTVVAMIIIIFTSFLSIFGEIIHDFLESRNFFLLSWIGILIDYKVVITIVGFFIAFVVLYAYLPDKKINVFTVMPGALIASVACWLFSKIFNFVVNHFWSLSMYGSLATIVVIMMYFDFFFYIFFTCAYINTYLEN